MSTFSTLLDSAANEAHEKAKRQLEKLLQLVVCKSAAELEVVAAAAGIDKEFEDPGFCYMLCFGLARRNQFWLPIYLTSKNALIKIDNDFFRKAWYADEYSMDYEHEENCNTRAIMLMCCNIELFKKNLDKVKELSEEINED